MPRLEGGCPPVELFDLRASGMGLGPHITTPLCKNVAVHHSKNCALMSQMGQSRRTRTFVTLVACPLHLQ
jgi:hypothetical protein